MMGGNLKGKKLLNFIVRMIEEKKGRDIMIIDVRKITTLTDFFVICTADVPEHSRAIYEELKADLKEQGNILFSEDGRSTGEWIVMDYGEVIVHIMVPEKREFYNLERIWREIRPEISISKK